MKLSIHMGGILKKVNIFYQVKTAINLSELCKKSKAVQESLAKVFKLDKSVHDTPRTTI